MSFICMKRNTFSDKWFHTNARFDTKPKGNLGMAHLFYLGITMFCCGRINKLSVFGKCLWSYWAVCSQSIPFENILLERTMKEIVLFSVYLLGGKCWSDGWSGVICPGGNLMGAWYIPWGNKARPCPGRECIIEDTWLAKSTSFCTLWPENSLGSISSAALSTPLPEKPLGEERRLPSWSPHGYWAQICPWLCIVSYLNSSSKASWKESRWTATQKRKETKEDWTIWGLCAT